MFVFIAGLLIALGGVGGVEQSIADSELALSVLMSLVGCALMYFSTPFLQEE
jgi:hypothetical protein